MLLGFECLQGQMEVHSLPGQPLQQSTTLTIRKCFSIPVLHSAFPPAQRVEAELIAQTEPQVFSRLPSHPRDSHRAHPSVGQLGGNAVPQP